jgi:AraC family transcriptional regulator, transcriptional activator of pobA
MKWEFEDSVTQGRLTVVIHEAVLGGSGLLNSKPETTNTIVYNTGADQPMVIDEVDYIFPANTILPLVANQHFRFRSPETLVAWQFNREFYCIADHDAEVGCVGFLFYGIAHPLFIRLSPEEMAGINTIEQLCLEDMRVQDKMQGEMLRTLLKRLIIKITRIAKNQSDSCRDLSDSRMDLIRRFNLLLECNFRSQHEVQFYAAALNKSPKTLANIFGMCHFPSPSKLIQQRIVLEAKRCLYYTGKSAKEIADDLGFTSAAHFSRFFKLNSGVNSSVFSRGKVPPRVNSAGVV